MKRFQLQRQVNEPLPPDGDSSLPTNNCASPNIRSAQLPGTRTAAVRSSLSVRQGFFVRHYLVTNNAAEAARQAGYSKKAARQQGAFLLTKPNIVAEITKRRAAIMEKLDITPQRIADELARIAFANMQDFMTLSADGAPVTYFEGLTRDRAAAVKEVTVEEFTDGQSREVRRVKIKLADKLNALMLLAKFLGMFTEKYQRDSRQTPVGVLLDEIDGASRRDFRFRPYNGSHAGRRKPPSL
jgi:phage terminase small subunit